MLEHGIMKRTILFAILLTVLSTESYSQPTALELSYFPLHMGNVWTFRKSFKPDNEPVYVMGYETTRVVRDTLANGKRYFILETFPNNTVLGSGAYRMDSLSGSVFCLGYLDGLKCPDTLEWEHMKVNIDSGQSHLRCGFFYEPLWTSTVIAQPVRVGILEVSRPQRILNGWLTDRTYAQGIGLCYTIGWEGGPGSTIRELTYARINSVEYVPVDLRSFTAAVLPGNQVHLRWRTENEIQNAGFSVQRRSADGGAEWDDLIFIPANAPEGEGADYEYTDNTSSDLPANARLAYRLRQLDYNGTESYSDIVEVALSHAPESSTLTAWPNPASTSLSMYARSMAEGSAQMLVTDLLGRELRRFEIAHNGVLTWDLTAANGARVPPGMYRLLLVGHGASVGRTVVVR